MATEWKGKSRGTVLGYRIFVFCMKKMGLGVAYFVLFFVASYYVLFAPASTRAIFYYFRYRLQYSFIKSCSSVFKSYYVFGQTIIDKVAISSGMREKFTYDFDGREHIIDTLREQKGGILISAHVGNFEIAEHFFAELEERAAISILTADTEHSAIKEYLESVTKKSQINLIFIKEDMSHIFEINAALARNELVCITGDRYFENTKFLEHNLLGESAKFPAGPFVLASRLKVPVLFVYVMKETNSHYHLYCRRSQAKMRDEKGLLTEYIDSVTAMLAKYPLQWFNYFNFWGKK